MKFVKLGIISIIVFSLLLWGITLLFPGTTVISRVRNLPGSSSSLQLGLAQNKHPYHTWLVPDSGGFDVRTADIPFYADDLYNLEPQPNADTLFFTIRQGSKQQVNGGIGFYQLSADSVTTQLFFVFRTPWYKPWEKMRMMMIDRQYGPQMDSALGRLYSRF